MRATLAVLVLLALAIVGEASGAAREARDAIAQPPASVLVHPDVHASIQRQGSARVIVELRLPHGAHVAEGDLAAPAAVVAQRQAIAAARAPVLARLAATGHRVVRQFRTVPFVVLEVGADAVRALEASSFDVVRVVEDGVALPNLFVSGPVVQADQAHARGFDGSGMTVAILDTGVDGTHPFFAGRIVEEACISAGHNCPNGGQFQTGPGAGVPCPIPGCGHGTHVAGIAAGDGATAGVTFSGMAPGASIMAVQIFSQVSGGIGAYWSDIMSALEYVYDLRDVHAFAAVNMSLGDRVKYTQPCDDHILKPSIDNLRSVGIATAISAGNSGWVDGLHAPACISSAISVAGSNMDDTMGLFTNVASFASLVAPGAGIASSVPGNEFAVVGGTSMSAPHVTGTWAVLKQASPASSVTDLLNVLQTTGLPIPDTRPGGTVTRPRIRLSSALDQLVGHETTPPTVTITGPANGATLSGTVTVSASANDNLAVTNVQFKLDGVNLGSADVTAPYSMSWNTAATTPGTHTLTAVAMDAAGNTTTSAPITVTVASTGGSQPVVWTSAVKVAVDGNSITKNAGCSGCADAGAISQQTIASGDGAVEFKVSANASLTVGLSTGNPGTSANEIKFGLRFSPGFVEVRESGVYKADWSVPAGAVHKVAVVAGAVKYFLNGTLKYTSAQSPTYPLLVDTSVWTVGAGVQGAVITTGSGGGTGAPADQTSPTVAITAPANGAVVSETVTVSVSASDNVGIVGVQILVDGMNLGAEDTVAPYGAAWNATAAGPGWHTLTAVARDVDGNTTVSAPVYVLVLAPPFSTTFTSPTPPWGSTVAGTVTINITLADAFGAPTWVTLTLDDTATMLLQQTTDAATVSFAWDTRTVADGSHTIYLTAKDTIGRSSLNSIMLNVANGGDTTPPTVTITAPANGATVSGTVTISATASDNVGVAGVQFKIIGSNVGAEDTAAPYAVAWNTTLMANRTYTLTAVARDTSGNVTTSAPVTVTVANDNTPPTVGITAPANGATVSGVVTVSATANDNTGVSGVQFKLDGALLGAEDTTAPYAVTWDTATAAPGTHTLTAVARDAAGNTTTSAPVSVTVANGGGPQNVVWTSAVNVAVSGNTITKNAGCNGCSDAGAISQQTIPSGSGSVSFTVSSGAQLTVGLSTGNAGTSASEIKFGLRFYPGSPGFVEVRESGVYKWDFLNAAGAVYKIAVEAGVVKYYQNGALKYTSTGSPTYPLVVDTSLNTIGSAVQNAVIGP